MLMPPEQEPRNKRACLKAAGEEGNAVACRRLAGSLDVPEEKLRL